MSGCGGGVYIQKLHILLYWLSKGSLKDPSCRKHEDYPLVIPFPVYLPGTQLGYFTSEMTSQEIHNPKKTGHLNLVTFFQLRCHLFRQSAAYLCIILSQLVWDSPPKLGNLHTVQDSPSQNSNQPALIIDLSEMIGHTYLQLIVS